jgi:hypothetical protein
MKSRVSLSSCCPLPVKERGGKGKQKGKAVERNEDIREQLQERTDHAAHSPMLSRNLDMLFA